MLRINKKPSHIYGSTNPQDIFNVLNTKVWMCNKAPSKSFGDYAALVLTETARKEYDTPGPIAYAKIKNIKFFKRDNDGVKYRDPTWTLDRGFDYLIELDKNELGVPICEYYSDITEEEVNNFKVNSRGYGKVK